jgi:Fe-S oxidoreductase
MDDRSLLRFRPGYAVRPVECGLDWSAWGGLGGAVEMCNNNGACRKAAPDVMCPSYRVTLDEQHSTRGRANSLRLALSGQLGPDALTSDAMAEAMELCVGCKACRRECPTGVDMSRMKTEFLHQRRLRQGVAMKDRLVGYLPRYAAWVGGFSRLLNLPGRSRLLALALERGVGFSARRTLPAWRGDRFRAREVAAGGNGPEVALLVDTFTTYFEPENARAAVAVLRAFGYRVIVATAGTGGGRPLCCGRTFLNVGLIDEARAEARRLLEALAPLVTRGVPVVGLEPSCLLTLRDELQALLPGAASAAVAERSFLLDEFLAAEVLDGASVPPLRPLPTSTLLVHGHCHQKAFGVDAATVTMLRWIPDLEVVPIESGCCGMAGSFGYDARHYDVSMRMAEADLLPAVRAVGRDTWVAASGTSCRHQIMHGTSRDAAHPVGLLALAITNARSGFELVEKADR